MGTDYTKDTGLSEMSKLPGIADLPSAVKVPFIKSLKAEEVGNHTEAEAQFAKAIEAEAAFQATTKK
jgi:hypothetical protein